MYLNSDQAVYDEEKGGVGKRERERKMPPISNLGSVSLGPPEASLKGVFPHRSCTSTRAFLFSRSRQTSTWPWVQHLKQDNLKQDNCD